MFPLLHLDAFGLTIRAQPAAIAVAIVAGLWLIPKAAADLEHLNRGVIARATIFTALCALIGARLHYVLASADWGSLTRVADGGLHAPGGVMGACVGVIASAFVFHVPAGPFADSVVAPAGVSIAISRIGCFLQGCCFGTPCSWPWCVSFPKNTLAFLLHADRHLVSATSPVSAPAHPLQLYFASAALLTSGGAIIAYPRKRFDGEIALIGLWLWAASSAALEPFRDDYPGRVYWGTCPQLLWVSLGIAIVCGSGWLVASARLRRRSDRAETEPQH
jgi:phosphatidylglycerol---prolipoprotein diacylglyceryl transferase